MLGVVRGNEREVVLAVGGDDEGMPDARERKRGVAPTEAKRRGMAGGSLCGA